MDLILEGACVLITGGANGIGRSMADAMLSSGANVHICDFDEPSVERFLEDAPNATATVADVSKEADVNQVIEEAIAAYSSINVLINNVGAFGPTKPIEDVSTQEWASCFDTAVHSAFYCARGVVPYFKRQKSGLILNISSVAGRLGNPNRGVLAVTKAALEGFTTTLAMELGPFGIRVNTLVPGLVDGPGARKLIKTKAQQLDISEDECMERFTGNISLRTMVRAEDIAAMAVFLASPMGERITGQRISICGNIETTRS